MHHFEFRLSFVLNILTFHKKQGHQFGVLCFFRFGMGFEPSRSPPSLRDGEGVGLERERSQCEIKRERQGRK